MSNARTRHPGVFLFFILPILLLTASGPIVSLWWLRGLHEQTMDLRADINSGMDTLTEIAALNQEFILADQRVTRLLEQATSGDVSAAQLYQNHTELVDLYAEIAERIDALSRHRSLRDSFSDPIAQMAAGFATYRGAMIQATDIVTIDPDLASEYRGAARSAFADFMAARYELSGSVTSHVKRQTDRELVLLVDTSDRLLRVSTLGFGLVFLSSLVIGVLLSRRIDLFSDYLTVLVEETDGTIPDLPRGVAHLQRSPVREFRSFARAMEKFRATLEDSRLKERALEQYQDNLERMVADRTEDLELYRLMIEMNATPAFMIDIEDGFRMAYVNEAAVRHFGYSREEILSWRIPDWDPNFTDEDLPAHMEEMQSHPGLVIETEHRVKGGDPVPVEVSLNLITYRGRACHFGYFMNISERRENEATMRDAKDRAEEAARVKSEFLANMSHEIRTPMNAVINLSRLALRTDLTERQRDYLTKILRSGEGLLGVINDVLDFSKIEAGRLELELIPFDPEELVREITDAAGFRAHRKNVEFIVDVPAELPRVVGDPLRLRQVLINLAGNALKFTEQGEVVLTTRILERGSDFITLDFAVSDTGIGMNDEQQARLFQAFQQADGSVSRKYGGSGLGLAISNRLLAMMGSTLRVESAPGTGSTFSFTLTMVPAGIEQPGTAETSRGTADITGLRVLVVDDNATVRDVFREMLASLGVGAHLVEAGEEGLAVLAQASGEDMPFDMAFIDWKMPHMDGIVLARRISEDARIDPKPRLILLTAYDIDEIRSEAKENGFAAVIEKPVSPSRLLNVLNDSDGIIAPPGRPGISGDPGERLRSIRGARVLVVEDSEINRQIAMEMLAIAGVSGESAPGGAEALVTLRQERYDLVLMDLEMPGMDGYETTRRIRREEGPALPVVAMTAHAMSGIREQCIAAGMNDHIAKPVDMDELYEVLLRWIPATGAGREESADTGEPTTTGADTIPPGELPGIDVQQGLRRVGGNRDLFLQLLGSFASDNDGAAGKISEALAGGRREEAREIAHRIRGVAGNLSATTLHDAARELEECLRRPEDRDPEEPLRGFEAAIGEILGGLHPLLSGHTLEDGAGDATRTGKTPTGSVDRHAVKSLVEELVNLMDGDIMGARTLIGKGMPLLAGTALEPEARRLNEALAEYDVDAAAEIAREILVAVGAETERD